VLPELLPQTSSAFPDKCRKPREPAPK
jgi:hypothetical protein